MIKLAKTNKKNAEHLINYQKIDWIVWGGDLYYQEIKLFKCILDLSFLTFLISDPKSHGFIHIKLQAVQRFQKVDI